MNTALRFFALATLIVVMATAEKAGYGQGGAGAGRPGGQFQRGPFIAILRDDRTYGGYGDYAFRYEAANGISREEEGTQKDGQVTRGGWRYTSPEGLPVEITFVADYNGFQPQGAVLPVSVPLPYQRSQVY